MGFSRPEYWSGLPCPPPGDLPNSGIEPGSPALQVDSTVWATRENLMYLSHSSFKSKLNHQMSWGKPIKIVYIYKGHFQSIWGYFQGDDYTFQPLWLTEVVFWEGHTPRHCPGLPACVTPCPHMGPWAHGPLSHKSLSGSLHNPSEASVSDLLSNPAALPELRAAPPSPRPASSLEHHSA